MNKYEKDSNVTGHLMSFLSVFVWGITFISTKVLLQDFEPIEILFYRFLIAFIILIIIYPHWLKGTSFKQELIFAGAGISGVTLYFLCENIALTYTTASNVSVIVSLAPFLTAILVYFILKEEKLKPNFFIGFLTAIAGIILISFNGSRVLKLNPIGDLLAVSAAFLWAVYSVFIKKMGKYGYHTIQITRRIFFYGILFMIPALFIMPFEWGFERFKQPVNLFNMLFLGLGASALCFVTWNYAVKLLGAVKTSVYIYMIPVITIVTAVIVLHEKITFMVVCGTILTLLGLLISEKKI